MLADEDLHRHAVENLVQADALLFGRDVRKKGSPADDAGLRGGTTVATIGGEPLVLGGDILLSAEGIPIASATNIAKIRDVLSQRPPNSPITVTDEWGAAIRK